MTDWQRLEQVIQWTGLSTNAFAKQIGLKRSENLYQIKRNNNRISKELSDLIVRRYPVFDRSWLLTGDGQMFDTAPRHHSVDRAGGIPCYHVDLLRLASDPSSVVGAGDPDSYLSVPGFGDCTFAALSTGDAMAPDIPPGSIVAVRQVDPAGAVLPGEIYIVVTGEYVRMGYLRPDRRVAEGLWIDPPAGSTADPVGLRRERIRRLYLVAGIVIRRVL